MGSSGSKSAEAASSSTPNGESHSNTSGMKEEIIGTVVDAIVLYGMFVTAKYVYKVRCALKHEGGAWLSLVLCAVLVA